MSFTTDDSFTVKKLNSHIVGNNSVNEGPCRSNAISILLYLILKILTMMIFDIVDVYPVDIDVVARPVVHSRFYESFTEIRCTILQ